MPTPSPSSFIARNVFTTHPDPYLWLIEVTSPTRGPIVDPNTGAFMVARVTPHRVPVEFGVDAFGQPKSYSPLPISFGDFTVAGDGDTFHMTLNVAATVVSLSTGSVSLTDMLAANDYLSQHHITLLLVHATTLDSSADVVRIRLRVIDASMDWRGVSFRLSAADESSFDIPQTIMTRDSCRWTYRGKGCDFVGDPDGTALGSCPKSLAGCEARGVYEVANGLAKRHPARFGAFPGLLRGAV